MPGATMAKFVVCDFEIPIKLFMIPQTVPNNPMNGAWRQCGKDASPTVHGATCGRDGLLKTGADAITRASVVQ